MTILTGAGDAVLSVLRRAGILAAAFVAVSCGTAETPVDSSGQESAADVLMSSIRDLKAADSGHYTYQVQVAGDATRMVVEHGGQYRLSSGTFEVVTETAEPPSTLVTRNVDGVTYMNSPGWADGMDECWLVFDEPELRSATGLDVDLTGSPQVVAALDAVEGERFGSEGREVIVGSVDLEAAVHLIASARYASDLAHGLVGRVQARFEMDGGSLSAWSVQGEDVVTAITSMAELDDDVAAAFTAISARIAYSQLGDSVFVEAPSADAVMKPEQMESGEGCRLMR